MKYIWNKKTDVITTTEDLLAWARALEDHESRMVEQTKINEVKVSTVFLGLDHGFLESSPILFETQIFGGKLNEYQ